MRRTYVATVRRRRVHVVPVVNQTQSHYCSTCERICTRGDHVRRRPHRDPRPAPLRSMTLRTHIPAMTERRGAHPPARGEHVQVLDARTASGEYVPVLDARTASGEYVPVLDARTASGEYVTVLDARTASGEYL